MAETATADRRTTADRKRREDVEAPARVEERPRAREGVMEFKHPVTGEILTRSLGNSNDSPYFIPPDIIPDGMHYEWKRKSTMGEPDLANMLALQRNGWRAVPAERHPERAVELDGLVLMEAPIMFVERARAEERRLAGLDRRPTKPPTQLPSGFTDDHANIRNANFARRNAPERTDPAMRPAYSRPSIDE